MVNEKACVVNEKWLNRNIKILLFIKTKQNKHDDD